MCAILGFQAPDNNHSRSLLQSLLMASSCRGLHSMSIAWRSGLGSEYELAFKPDLKDIGQLAHNGRFNILAHCRYSTSSLTAPGVIAERNEGGQVITMMNGVICQDLPTHWPLAEIEPYKTGNDTEIAHRFATVGMWGEHGGAFAVGMMAPAGEVTFWRNGARPLWYIAGIRDGVSIVASTKDIIRRTPLGHLCIYAEPVRSGQVFWHNEEGLEAVPNIEFDPGPELQSVCPLAPTLFSTRV